MMKNNVYIWRNKLIIKINIVIINMKRTEDPLKWPSPFQRLWHNLKVVLFLYLNDITININNNESITAW